MRSWWTLLLSTLLAGLTACGMTVKVKPIGEVQYPENANRELDFFTEPLDWMDPVVVIGIQGADDDQYMAVRKRACEIAAKHGAEALLVIDEKRVAGGWHTSNVAHFTDFDVVEYQRNWRPDCLYIGVRRVQETPEKKRLEEEHKQRWGSEDCFLESAARELSPERRDAAQKKDRKKWEEAKAFFEGPGKDEVFSLRPEDGWEEP